MDYEHDDVTWITNMTGVTWIMNMMGVTWVINIVVDDRCHMDWTSQLY